MALFKNEEKKQAKEEARLAAAAEKEYKLLQKFGVENLQNPADIKSVRKIAQELVATNILEASMTLSLSKASETLPVYYQRAMLEQNFIIIRQLDELNYYMRNLTNGQN